MTNGLWSDPHTARMEPDNNKNKVRDYRQFVKRSHSWDDGELPVLFDAANTPLMHFNKHVVTAITPPELCMGHT